MVFHKQTIGLKASCSIVGKATDVFAPIKDAIANSLDAITQRQIAGYDFAPIISLEVHFLTAKNKANEDMRILDFITIEDNGIGFTFENFARFKDLGDQTKRLNNRGTGKIQIFSRFNEISVDSTYIENDIWSKLSVNWKLTDEFEDTTKKIEKQIDTKTIVKMSGFYGGSKEQEFFSKYLVSIGELKKDILKRFLLRLWLGNATKTLTLTIKTFLDKKELENFIFDKSNIPTPDKVEKISINTEQARIITDKNKDNIQIEWFPVEPKYDLTIHRFKLQSSELDENGVNMCSKDIVVEPFKFPLIGRKDANFSGFRYLACIRGDILDDPEHVSHTVDKFIFQSKASEEESLKEANAGLFNPDNKFVFWEEIKDKVGSGLVKAYSDVQGLSEARQKEILELADRYGIPHEDVEGANIPIDESEEKTIEKLFETQAKRLAKSSIVIRQTYDELKELEIKKLDPSSDDYRKKLRELSKKLLEKIPQQNKDELARYIIRRNMVVDLLKFAIKSELAKQKDWEDKKRKGENIRPDKEGIIHDLIFKRGMKGVPNDLWILNEEFVHFNGCSDVALTNLEVNGEKLLRPDVDINEALKAVELEVGTTLEWRPDIFLYPEEGKCILVEFKAPDVEITRHCDQIQKYAKIIANYSKKKFTQFFGFLIGEQIQQLAIPGRYRMVPYGNYWVYPSEPINNIVTGLPIADIYQEIIPLSEIAKRAEIRNRSFEEKLGITKSSQDKARGESSQEAKPRAINPPAANSIPAKTTTE